MTDSTRPVTGYPAQSNGTAYAYAAPPPPYYPPQQQQQQQNPNYYNTNPYYSAERANFIRRIISILIASVIITGTIVFIIWLVLRPTVPDFRVDSLRLSDFNLSQQQLVSGNWDLNLTVRNPNKKITLAFDQILAKILYKSGPLSETMVPPFGLGKREQTPVRASFAAASSYVEKAAVDGINEDKGRGSVRFNVRLVARVRFRAGSWWARQRVVRVLCSDLAVGMAGNSSGGSLLGGAKQCRVGV